MAHPKGNEDLESYSEIHFATVLKEDSTHGLFTEYHYNCLSDEIFSQEQIPVKYEPNGNGHQTTTDKVIPKRGVHEPKQYGKSFYSSKNCSRKPLHRIIQDCLTKESWKNSVVLCQKGKLRHVLRICLELGVKGIESVVQSENNIFKLELPYNGIRLYELSNFCDLSEMKRRFFFPINYCQPPFYQRKFKGSLELDYYVQLTDSHSLVKEKDIFVQGCDQNEEWMFDHRMRKYLLEECKALANCAKDVLDLAYEVHQNLNLTYNDNLEYVSVFSESTWQSYLYQQMLRFVFTRYKIHGVPYSELGCPTNNASPEEFHFTKVHDHKEIVKSLIDMLVHN